MQQTQRRYHPLIPAIALAVIAAGGLALVPRVPPASTLWAWWLVIGAVSGYAISGFVCSLNSADLLSSSVWRDRARWYFAGGELLGGATTGILLVIVGSLLRPLLPTWLRLGVLLVLAVVVVGNETRLFRVPLPQNGRQVPSSVIFEGGRLGALQFGFEMGTGLRTFMTSSLPHLTALTIRSVRAVAVRIHRRCGVWPGQGGDALGRMASGDGDAWDRQLSANPWPFRMLSLSTCLAGVTAILYLSW